MPSRAIPSGFFPLISLPRKVTDPSVGGKTPVMILNSVVFPAPLGPITPLITPSSALKLTWDKAVKPANLFDTP
jgi:hypothetical protein